MIDEPDGSSAETGVNVVVPRLKYSPVSTFAASFGAPVPVAASVFVSKIVREVPEIVKVAEADKPLAVLENVTASARGASHANARIVIKLANGRDIRTSYLRPLWRNTESHLMLASWSPLESTAISRRKTRLLIHTA